MPPRRPAHLATATATATRIALVFALAAACSSDDPGTGPDAAAEARGLPVRHDFDPDRAEAGRSFLFDAWPGSPVIPNAALTSLYLVWGTGSLVGEAYWDEFERRYGFFKPAGFDWPLGFHDAGSNQLTLSCLGCHADEGPTGELIVGVGNRRLDFRRLFEDMQTLADLAGVTPPPVPDGLQASPGPIDAVGLGVRLADGGDTEAFYGYQQAPAWWQQRFKDRQFTDGSSDVANHRTMMATLMLFGWTQEQMAAYDDEFLDLQQFLFSLEPPAWPLAAPAPDAVERGEALFDTWCAGCHGSYHGDAAAYPELVIAADAVGTDSVRTVNWGAAETEQINATWFAEPGPFVDTDGYLAPPLVGVWASAPYFHNGSVPDLAGVLDSAARPARWQLVDPPAYDAARGGYAVEDAADGAPRAYDTALPGLGAGGHSYGDPLTAAERADLIAYLTTL